MARVVVALVGVLASACGHVGYDAVDDAGDDAGDDGPDADPRAPIHRYRLDGNLLDDHGGPALVEYGGSFTPGGYAFPANGGLSVDGAMPASVYTVEIVFSFAALGGWRKVLDFKELATDEGLYVYDDHVQFVVVAGSEFANGATPVTTGQTLRVTLTRDGSGEVIGYRDGAREFSFVDRAGVAELGAAEAHFVIDDDTTTMQEASAGVIRSITIWGAALTAAEL